MLFGCVGISMDSYLSAFFSIFQGSLLINCIFCLGLQGLLES